MPALLGWVLGTLVQLLQSALWPLWNHVLVLVLVVIPVLVLVRVPMHGWSWRGRGRSRQRSAVLAPGWRGIALLLAFAALAFAVTGVRSAWYVQQALVPALEGRDVRVTGLVRDLPQFGPATARFRLQLESAQLLPRAAPVAGGAADAEPDAAAQERALARLKRIDVAWFAPGPGRGADPVRAAADAASPVLPVLRAGERWRMTVRLKAPHGHSNPGGFDYELWLWEQGVQASASVRSGVRDEPPERLGATVRAPLAWARQAVRERIAAQVAETDLAGVLVALVVGDQSAISGTDWALFRDTGVAHLVSISGLHVTMFAWGACALVGWLWRRSGSLCKAWPAPAAALCGGLVLATAYAAFSGWGLPAQRTCLMLACVVVLRLVGVRWPWPQVWMLTCAVVVACDPWALLQPGFWLSFVAVAVLFATDAGPAAPPNEAVAQSRWQRLLYAAARQGGGLLREQWLITLALAPLTAFWFGQVSLVGLVANLLAVPLVTLVITPLAMLGVAWPWLWEGAALVLAPCMTGLRWLAALPAATLALPDLPGWLIAAGLLGSALLVLRLPGAWRMAGAALLLPAVLWQPHGPAPGEFSVLAADVGQGNAVLVRTAHHALLYDAGPRYGAEADAGQRVLLPLLRAQQVVLDLLVLSHRDTDHAGGAESVLLAQPQAQLRSSIESGHPLQALRPVQRCVAGQRWYWDGVQFDMLHPQPGDYARGVSANGLSCVLRIESAQGVTALLVGDIEKAQEAQLVAAQAPLQADLLLVPHHGSRTSSSAAFLDAVRPQVALVQSGYRNRYGHPQVGVLQRYAERAIPVHDSPHCGAATWTSLHPAGVSCSRMEYLRYWHHRVP